MTEGQLMTATPPDTGMGPATPAVSTRSTRRTRRLAIVGALALVLVAGAVLVGVTTTGARSGLLSSTATKVNTGLYCFRSYNADYSGDTGDPTVWLAWKLPSDAPDNTIYRAYQRTNSLAPFTYSDELGRAQKSDLARMADGSIPIDFSVTDTSAQTYVITWGASSTGDLYYSEVSCPAS